MDAQVTGRSVTGRSVDDLIQSGNSFDVLNVDLFDGEKIVERVNVAIRDGWIHSVSSSGMVNSTVRQIDGAGKFLMPSLIDFEGHFSTPNEMLLGLISSDSKYVKDKLASLMENDGLFEIDTHGLNPGHGRRPSIRGMRGPIPPSANFEKHHRFGVTTVIDQGAFPWPANYMKRSRNCWAKNAPLDLRKEFLIYADLYSSGMWAAPAGLQFGYFGTDPVYNHWQSDEFSRWVDRRIGEGADHIKVFYEHWGRTENSDDAPVINRRSLGELVKATHARGKKVFVHSGTFSTTLDLIEVQADGGIHTPGSDRAPMDVIDAELAARFANSVRTLTPTMSVMLSECNGPYSLSNPKILEGFLNAETLPYLNALDELRLKGDTWESENPDRYLPVFETVARMCDAGALLTVGSDSGSFGPYVEGLSLHHEMFLIHEAVKKFSKRDPVIEALKAGTSSAALSYGLAVGSQVGDPRGFVQPGYRADLLLLKKSPVSDIQNTLKIESVFKAGYELNRQPVR